MSSNLLILNSLSKQFSSNLKSKNKNEYKFDVILPEEVSLEEVFRLSGAADMINRVVTVISYVFDFGFRVITRLFLLMARQDLERHLLWKVVLITKI